VKKTPKEEERKRGKREEEEWARAFEGYFLVLGINTNRTNQGKPKNREQKPPLLHSFYYLF
jgi:hypothetical protein